MSLYCADFVIYEPNLFPDSVLGSHGFPHVNTIYCFWGFFAVLLCFQLSNEMQLSIMNKVKSGELSIEDALNQARMDRKQLLKQKSVEEKVPAF